MKKICQFLGLLCAVALVNTSCGDEVDRTIVHYSPDEYEVLSERLELPAELYEYGKNQQDFIAMGGQEIDGMDGFQLHNIQTNHIATLGRVLFYDTRLSANNTVSCASCHQQQLAFADDVPLSVGFDGDLSLRNSLPLGNTVGFDVAYGGGFANNGTFVGGFGPSAFFGWDESNPDVQSQTLAAITSTVEMGMHNAEEVIDKIKDDPAYEILFDKAFQNKPTSDGMLSALDGFVNSISSTASKFDKGASSAALIDFLNDFDLFTIEQNEGKRLYIVHCATCHSIDHSFTALARANNGLNLTYEDQGVGGHTGLQEDMGVFKVPFLRNIELTAPYMHDGRFESLEEVVDFYSEGIQAHENLHPALRSTSGGAKKIGFTDREKASLIAYLKTLTDEELITEPKWSDPFK